MKSVIRIGGTRTDAGPGARTPVRYLIDPRDLSAYTHDGLEGAALVSQRFAFRANDYYLGLVDWSDPADPLRRLIVPDERELDDFGELDASDEAANTQLRGLQHKYSDTAVLLVTDQCAGFCRYCFRKRLFLPGSREANRDLGPGLAYVAAHPEITDVLLSGGDPLTLPTKRLAEILRAVSLIPHVRTIRIGTKTVAFNPYRILEDAELHEALRKTVERKRVWVMCHFDHPKELTPEAVRAVGLLRSLGAMCANQCPISAGVNDDADVLARLFQRCTETGCPQYYVFQCRPTAGNAPFAVPVVRGFSLVSEARSQLSGLSRRARFCMSHARGKIEVVGVDERHVFARYHRAKDPSEDGRMLVLRRDDGAHWLDDLEEVRLAG